VIFIVGLLLRRVFPGLTGAGLDADVGAVMIAPFQIQSQFQIQLLGGLSLVGCSGGLFCVMGPSGLGLILEGWICRARFPQPFSAFFVKPGDIWNCSANVKKSEFGFPLSSFPSFESNCPLEGSPHLLDFGSWFRSSSQSLTGGTPPSFASFGEFAEAVLLKKSE
jgi:hypothetical protein